VVKTEGNLARLLAETFRDDGLWRDLATADDTVSAMLAARAVTLYRGIWPVMDASRDADATPLYHAVAVIREVADAAAISAYPWTESERAEFNVWVPTRAIIELQARLYDVGEWVAEFGESLDLRHQGVPEEAWNDEPDRLDNPGATLAENVATTLTTYGMIVEAREIARQVIATEEAHRWASALVSGARGSLLYGRGRLPPEAEPALVAQLYAAEAIFVASREVDDPTDLFPSLDFIRWLLEPEAVEWLVEEGADLPDWLE